MFIRYVVTLSPSAGHFSFKGFLRPVDNLPAVNVKKAGSSIPLKFSLNGNQGMGILAADSPSVTQVSCETGAPTAVFHT
ncbi:hypothetical protein GCM10008955_30750 [Deinococcus malanensis]|uniref:Uncharacterized protein n=1 Tax=Deinococcus malanensis TaxID=1706855 RepID=A0ABQ2EZC9_9DEIO|nr:hypothetical protein GCM10008955_30750 [Deinococcus malanensis]